MHLQNALIPDKDRNTKLVLKLISLSQLRLLAMVSDPWPWLWLLLRKGERVARKFLCHLKCKAAWFSKNLNILFNANSYSLGKLPN